MNNACLLGDDEPRIILCIRLIDFEAVSVEAKLVGSNIAGDSKAEDDKECFPDVRAIGLKETITKSLINVSNGV